MKINATLIDGYKVDTKVDNHSYILDQKESAGGTDAGTAPSNVLMTSVLGCKTMVAKGFLDAREFGFDKIESEIDFEITGSNLHPSAEITVTVKVLGADLDEKEQEQIHRIVDTGCPMANLLDPEKTTIETKVEVTK